MIPFEHTSADELAKLASALLAAPETAPLLRKAGVHGDFSEAQAAILERFIAEYARAHFAHSRDPMLLQLAVVLARWVSGGLIPDAHGEEAREFLHDRAFHRTSDEVGIHTVKPTIDEVRMVALDLKRDERVWRGLVAAGDGELDEAFYCDVLLPRERQSIEKYGLTNRTNCMFIFALRWMIAGYFKSLDPPHLEIYLSKYTQLIRG